MRKLVKAGLFKKLVIFCLVMMVFLNIGLVEASAKGDFGIQKFQKNGENLEIVFSGTKSPKEKDTKVYIGEQEFPVEKIVNSKKYEEGSSYVFVIDVSGSIDNNQNEFMKSIMKELANQKETKAIKIIIVGEEVKEFDTVTGGKDEMNEKIDSIEERKNEAGLNYTSLYAGIVKALEVADEDKDMTLVRSVVVFSDGFETKDNSLTQGEVLEAVKESRIPLFTVPVAAGVNVTGGEDTNEILSSFARKSLGGIAADFQNLRNEEDIISGILSAVKKINIAKIDIKKLKAGKDTRELKLSYKDETDSISIDISKFDIKAVSQEKTSVEPNMPIKEKESNSTIIMYSIIGASVLLAILIIFFVLKGMKNSQVMLIFNLGNKEIKKKMKYKLTIGRDMSKVDFPMPSDERLSSIHCMIFLNKKNLYIKDLDSTNGTYVNGRKVKDTQILSKGDILLIGSVEMKISWE